MNGAIDMDGHLFIDRNFDIYRPQICPYSNKQCGDWCPLFQVEEMNDSPGHQTLTICNGNIIKITTDSRENVPGDDEYYTPSGKYKAGVKWPDKNFYKSI